MLDKINSLSKETPHQDAIPEELDAVSSAWHKLAALALQNKKIYILDKGMIATYKDDRPWIQFLSTQTDNGVAFPRSVTQVSILGNYKMAKTLMLPSEKEIDGIGDV